MKKFFSKILSFMLIFSVFISSFSLNIINVHADGEHQYILKAYDWNAFDNDWEGSGTGDELINNADVEPGKVIQLSIYYIPGTDPDMMMQMAIKYDSNLVEPMYDEGSLYLEADMSTTYQGGIWPAVGKSPDNKKKTNWTVSANDASSYSMISVLAEDTARTKALTTEGVIASVYFKIKDTAKAGSVITFEYDNSRTKLTKYKDGTERPVITEGINLNVFGKMSANTLLKSLSVKNGTQEYPLNPTFVPDSETVRDYQTTVPNNITSVDISATASDTSGKVLPGGLGTKSLNVGENNFNLVVQSQDGTQEIYRLTVYRLNNDATLKSLTLTNGVNIGTFSGGTTSYTATVPYKTKSSEVTALTNDSNAVITSGTGTFDFINYGTTLNTHNITVNAENCDSKYASVPGNTCTSKTYTITVTRTSPSSNNNLSNLTVNNKTVTNFNKNTLEYTLPNVSNETTSLLVGAVVEDTDKAQIKSGTGTVNLNIGDNTLNIVVKAENGDEKTYKLLNSKFDSYNGEAYYNDKMEPVVEELKEKGLLKESQGAQVVDLEKYNMPPCIIITSAGTTIYATRDLASLEDRMNTYNFDKAIYVVGNEQALHFKQVFKVFELMGYENYAKNCVHIPFGLVVDKDGEKIGSRKGNSVFLEDILNEAIDKVKDIINEKNPELEDKEEVARKVGVGAIIFNDLSNSRIKDEIFDWDMLLNFQGETGPYIQYIYVRTRSLLNKAGYMPKIEEIDFSKINEKEALDTLKLIYQFNDVIKSAAEKNEPSILARYLIDLSQSFSTYYNEHRIITEDKDVQNARLFLTYSVGTVLKTGAELLGMEMPERM